MAATSEWETVGAQGEVTIWTPSDDDKVLEGVLHEVSKDVGPNKSTIYVIKDKENTLLGVWETTVLASKMSEISIGNEVRITYLGPRPSKKGGTYHDFKVETRPVEEVVIEDIFSE